MGSLLRGLLGADPATMTGLTRALRPGASLVLLVSSTAADNGAAVAPLDERSIKALAEAYARYGRASATARP